MVVCVRAHVCTYVYVFVYVFVGVFLCMCVHVCVGGIRLCSLQAAIPGILTLVMLMAQHWSDGPASRHVPCVPSGSLNPKLVNPRRSVKQSHCYMPNAIAKLPVGRCAH